MKRTAHFTVKLKPHLILFFQQTIHIEMKHEWGVSKLLTRHSRGQLPGCTVGHMDDGRSSLIHDHLILVPQAALNEVKQGAVVTGIIKTEYNVVNYLTKRHQPWRLRHACSPTQRYHRWQQMILSLGNQVYYVPWCPCLSLLEHQITGGLLTLRLSHPAVCWQSWWACSRRRET